MSNSQDSNFIKHFLNVGAGTLINVLLGLISTPLITRVADPSEYGLFSIFNVYNDIAIAFLFIGLDRGIVRFFYNSKDIKDQKSLLKLCFLAPICAGLIVSLVFLSLTLSGTIQTKFVPYVLVLLCVYVLVNIWNRLSTLMLRLTYQTDKYSFCTVIQKLVYVLIILIFAFGIKKNYLLMLILASTLSFLTAAIIGTMFTKKYWNFNSVNLPNNKVEIFKYSVPFIAYALMDSLLDSMDKLTLERLCSDYEVGIYASAAALVAIFMIFRQVFETIWVPMQTEHFVTNPNDKSFIQKGNRYLTIIMVFVCLNVLMFKDVICYILGSSYRNAASILPFLMLGQVMYSISDTTTSGIDYSKRSYLHVIVSLIAVVVNIVGNLSLIPIWGSKGAALSTCLSFLMYLLFRIVFSTKYYYIDYGTKKLSVIIMCLFAFAYINTFYNFGMITIISYLIITILYVVLYLSDMKEMFNYFMNTLLKK